jgi:predicted aspartyl protease
MKRYRLQKTGSLLITKAALTGPHGTKILNLLIDTGSTYTIAPTEALEATGCSPAESKEHIRIITGSGTILAPLVKISRFECLGRRTAWNGFPSKA